MGYFIIILIYKIALRISANVYSFAFGRAFENVQPGTPAE
jgi:hypothetical protein